MDARFRVYFGELTYFVSNEQILWNAPSSLQTFPVLKKMPQNCFFFTSLTLKFLTMFVYLKIFFFERHVFNLLFPVFLPSLIR